MASVAVWVTLQVVLMLWLGFPKRVSLSDFRHNLPRPKGGRFDVRGHG